MSQKQQKPNSDLERFLAKEGAKRRRAADIRKTAGMVDEELERIVEEEKAKRIAEEHPKKR